MDRTPVRSALTPDGRAAGVLGAALGTAGEPGVAAAGVSGVAAAPEGEAGALADVLSGLGRARDLVALASQAPFDGVDAETLARVIAIGGRLRSAVEALLLASTAALEAAQAGSGRAALRRDGRMSARKAARIAAVSKQIAQMPRVAHGLACGELTVEHAEVLADAARRSSPRAVDTAQGLLDTAAKASPEVLRRDAQAFVAEHDPMAAETEIRRQRRDRSAAMFVDDETGMGVLNARFDPVSFAAVAQAVENYNDALWRLDGGRDGTPGAVRDNRQRLADSVFEMLTGRNALATQQGAAVLAGGATGRAAGGGDGGGGSGDRGTDGGRQGERGADGGARRIADSGSQGDAVGGRSIAGWTPAGAPNQLVIVADIGVIDGTAPDGRCDVLGAGPVPKSILDDLSPDTRISGALFGGLGEPLWLGRSRRLANVAQQLAIAIRDRGCVLCGAPMHRCKFHHIEEWDADQGLTDVSNLAAMCRDCHDNLHKSGRCLRRDPLGGHWTTRKRPRRSAGWSERWEGRSERADGWSRRSAGRSDMPDRSLPETSPASGRGPPE